MNRFFEKYVPWTITYRLKLELKNLWNNTSENLNLNNNNLKD